MSMDLYLWKAPVIDDSDEAAALLDRWYEQDDRTVFEASDNVTLALAKIRDRFPDDPEDGADDSAPWASWPIEDSDRLIALNIRWSVDNEVLDYIVAVAAEHDLVIYDPQGPDVYRAQDAPEPQPTERATAKDFYSVMLMFLPIAGATVAAWWFIPWGWLRWPLVAIGLFFTISAGIVVYVMIASAMGWSDDEPSTS
jgi:hypothetical protein